MMPLLINFYVLAAPSGFDRIVVLERASRYITVSWDPPAAPNGIIVNYTVLLGGDVIIATPPDVLQYRVSPLLPFSMYTFSVMACTSAGCVESQEIQSTTLEDGEIRIFY
jgi:usherin